MNPCLECLERVCRWGCICMCHRDPLSNLFCNKLTPGQLRSRAKIIGMELADK